MSKKPDAIKINVSQYDTVPWDTLKHYDANSLKRGEKRNVDKLKNAIVKQGFSFPFFVWAGHQFIIDGAGRIAALKELEKAYKIPNLPVVEIKAKDYEHAKILVLQASSEHGEVTQDSFAVFVEDLDIESLLDQISFPDIDLDFDIPTIVDEEKQDEIPEVLESVCKPGDLWLLGNHRLLCGDAFNNKDIDKLICGEIINLVFTDPPYGMKLDTSWANAKSKLSILTEKGITGGNEYKPVEGDFTDFDPSAIMQLFNHVSEQFWWGADYYAERIPNKNNGSFVVWDKRGSEEFDKMYGSCFELCWSKTKHKRDIARITWAGVFGIENETDKNRVHPAQKPIKLIQWFFDKWCENLTTVLDLFGGSGSTMLACEKAKKHCLMMEIDPHYCDIILKRWENLTGEVATLEEKE